MRELADETLIDEVRIRCRGGGRKSYVAEMAGLEAAFLAVLAEHTAGSPMDESIKWPNLTRHEIAVLLQAEGFTVSVTVVDQLLEQHDYRKRKAVKTLATGASVGRDAQFENIESLKQEDRDNGQPVMSMDTKKKN